MVVFEEVGFGHHYGVPKTAEVRAVLNLLGEDVAGVDDVGDVDDCSGDVSADLADFYFAEVNIFYLLVCKGRGPRNRSGIAVANCGCLIGFKYTKIGGAKLDPEKFKGVFVGGVDLSLI